jgi:signal peptidase II
MPKWLSRNYWYVLLFIGLFLLDQATKKFSFEGDFGSFLDLLRPAIGKQLFPNYHFAFSLPVPTAISYIIYALLLSGLIIWFIKLENKSLSSKIAFVLVLTGALSNILDRMALGYVRDFIYIGWGGVFNLADVLIILGVLIILREK